MASEFPDFDTALVPMQLEAFVLNPAVCGTGEETDTTARISPITQPNYTFLRLDNFLLQSDVQNHTDLHNTAPASTNSRMTDLGALGEPKPLRHRHGVYIHWTLPRFYRSGISSSESVSPERRRNDRLRRGLDALSTGEGGNDTPDFLQPPTRWIVLRKLEVDSVQPEDARNDFKDREYEAWVVESDHLWLLDDIPTDMDLQTDLAPFVLGHQGSDIKIDEQAEVFIGRKTPLAEWSGEDEGKEPPDISLLRSGNQLFADFQMHNSNVFSVLDNFQYGTKDDPKYLSYAKASYYVLGWHRKEDVDPLWNSGKNFAHGESLEELFLTMKGVDDSDSWMSNTDQLRILCHGAMYDVTWDHENKPKDVPADKFSARMSDPELAAVSIGTTPMDAMISYCTARQENTDDSTNIAKLEEDILALESLLHARDDGVEAQREAKDAIYNWSFSRSPGGSRYYFSGQDGDDKKPLVPEKEAISKLRQLNQTQKLLDAGNMAILHYRWDMFSLWWKYVSDVGNSSNEQAQSDEFKEQVDNLSQQIKSIQDRIQQLQKKIEELLQDTLLATAKPASMPVFNRANDPTVLIGGIESGWPLDYLDKVSVRAPFQVIAPENGSSDLPNTLKDVLEQLKKLPEVFQGPSKDLVTEFYLLRPGGGNPGEPKGKFYPQFHDKLTTDERWRDQWGDRQPWFPLYAEWEVEYTHIPFDYWKLDEHTARLSANESVRYGISVPPKDGQEQSPPLWDALKENKKGPDTRVLSGRVLILPQPTFSLEAKLVQLFQNTPPDILDKYLPEADRQDLLSNVKKLSYLSSPLYGLTNGLVTQAQGSHIKPENKTVGADGTKSSAIEAAVFESVGLTKESIEMIDGNSALTPYAALTNFEGDEYCPFKPATHGQFRYMSFPLWIKDETDHNRFRKFNIIDKFGQALMAIDQKPRIEGLPPLYPCISDYYEPQKITVDGQDHANTVIKDEAKQCEFLQLPPQINQNARLNAEFVKRIADDKDTQAGDHLAKWRPATEWESPIWGWMITNYADYGIQLFLADGTFYREVRFGGPKSTLDSPEWLPFAPSQEDPTPETRQLDALAAKLADKDYIQGFWNMITTAQANLSAAPSAYAQFLNSVVGKPLALVNMGWSLELDGPPLENQSTKSNVEKPECRLTHEDDETPFYEFQVRLGDRDAEYDGLVGYFDTKTPQSDELNLDYVKTFFVSEKDTSAPLESLNTENYPRFTPFWEDPFPAQSSDPANFEDRRNARFSVFGAIIDPFTPVHAYSSILPSVELSLPPWTWQSAMNTMTAFFHAGPLSLPINDVPDYDSSQILTSKNARDMPKRDLPLPSLGPGDWSWFQPYAEGEGVTGDGNDTPQPVFNPFGIQKRGNLTKPGFQKGPYTALEGFLQLRNPIMMPRDDK
ncbi:uncharacterized protein K452DRAFT_343301 [Aplosporella prunicola CBS 121167]|uniref:Uncharacterized protein n=1 Tax=Aplosporella prunicola CBS 121167 TaxID=1176127 RepID=A0A6A6BQI0_9PEZI|nr:uncharacterized protein K452DRAFT_343301 [Aplosporella prunicola CBS 121167]KAF2144841.1 hypothetical protein K452DRAFT_343301 [Aplosporella prunicola CBS 121167]